MSFWISKILLIKIRLKEKFLCSPRVTSRCNVCHIIYHNISSLIFYSVATSHIFIIYDLFNIFDYVKLCHRLKVKSINISIVTLWAWQWLKFFLLIWFFGKIIEWKHLILGSFFSCISFNLFLIYFLRPFLFIENCQILFLNLPLKILKI